MSLSTCEGAAAARLVLHVAQRPHHARGGREDWRAGKIMKTGPGLLSSLAASSRRCVAILSRLVIPSGYQQNQWRV